MECLEFVDYLDNDFCTLCDELYWDGGFDAQVFFNYMKLEADKIGVRLTDLSTFDYENYFYILYQNTEKGLS